MSHFIAVKCIWNFNGCVEKRFYPEATCYSCFDECKMVVMGMADPMQGHDSIDFGQTLCLIQP